MGKTHRELVETITHYELCQWVQFYKEEPWGQRRLEITTAQAGQAICASLGNDKLKTQDLLPISMSSPEPQVEPWEELFFAKAKAYNIRNGYTN